MKEKHINTQTLFVHKDILHPKHTRITAMLNYTSSTPAHRSTNVLVSGKRGEQGSIPNPSIPKDVLDVPTSPGSTQGGPSPCPPRTAPALSRDPAELWQPQCQAGNAQAEEQQQSSEPSIISEPAQSDGIWGTPC